MQMHMKIKIPFILATLVILNLCACSHPNAKANKEVNYSIAVNTGAFAKPKPKVAKFPRPCPPKTGLINIPKNYGNIRNLTGAEAVDAANKKALRVPRSQGYFDAIMTFDYVPGGLYQIYCAPLSITDVTLQQNEHITSVAAGDTLRWQVSKTFSGSGGIRQEHLLLKPAEEGLNNSVVVTTDRRTYHLLLLSTTKTYMASVTWHYSDENDLMQNGDSDADDQAQQASIPGGRGNVHNLDMDHLDFAYKAKTISGYGRPYWMPSLIFNDGSKTYIKFPSNVQEAPTLFIGNSLKYGRIVNYRVEGNYYIVDSLVSQAQLRSGQNNQFVVQITHQ